MIESSAGLPAALTQFGHVEETKVCDDDFRGLITTLQEHILTLEVFVNDTFRMKITHALTTPQHNANMTTQCRANQLMTSRVLELDDMWPRWTESCW